MFNCYKTTYHGGWECLCYILFLIVLEGKRLKYLIPSLLQSLIIKPFVWIPSPLNCKTGRRAEWSPQNPMENCQKPAAPLRHTSPWGWTGSTQECWGSLWKCSPRHIPLFTSSPGWLGRSQLTEGWPVWHSSTREAGRRIQGITGLSVWSLCQMILSAIPQPGDQALLSWVGERQGLLGQPHLLPL